jgi:hypothetical protein
MNIQRALKGSAAATRESWAFIQRYPQALLPLLFVWIFVFAPVLLYLRFNSEALGGWKETSLIVLGVHVLFAFCLTISASVLCEFIEQVEMDEKPSIFRALQDTISSNLLSLIPLSLVWAVLWFVLSVLSALKRKGNDDDDDAEALSAQTAFESLHGGSDFSLGGFALTVINQQVRMIAFLVVPGIAWRGDSFGAAWTDARSILREHFLRFQTGYLVTRAMVSFIYIPVIVLLIATNNKHGLGMDLPSWVFTAGLIYGALVWSLSMYLEQMFCALLYLWHHKWEVACLRARQDGQPYPSFDQIPPPDLLDGVADLQWKPRRRS